MADSTLKRYKTTVETLQKLAECAVCLETLKTPIKLCTRGHMMCCSCVETLTACPTCEAEFTFETPVGVRYLLEALPKLCRYSPDGCQDVVESGSDHETYCGYRPETCREPHCGSVVPVCELLKHYESEHPDRYVITEEVDEMRWDDFNPSENRSDNIPIFLFGSFFYITKVNDINETQLRISFQVVPIGKPVEDYYVCAEFKNEIFRYCYTLKASVRESEDEIKHSEYDQNTSDESKKAGNQELYCMKIPTAQLKRFISKDKALVYTFNFVKEDSQ